MKAYSVRMTFNFQSNSDRDVQKSVEYFIKELPKMDGVNIDSGTFDHILNSFSDKIQTTVYENLEYHSDHNPVISTITI